MNNWTPIKGFQNKQIGWNREINGNSFNVTRTKSGYILKGFSFRLMEHPLWDIDECCVQIGCKSQKEADQKARELNLWIEDQ